MEPQQINNKNENRHEEENNLLISPNTVEEGEGDPLSKNTTFINHNCEDMAARKLYLRTNTHLEVITDSDSETSSSAFFEQYTGETGIELSEISATASDHVEYMKLRGRLQSLLEVEDELM